ncbi:Leucyl aminopeptidase (aminopeptidase T) [Methanocella conradii HZ254]|uniref:Leucyl aminopeptidase (Aminopeptidase T) n=1 Tax=Methanocella conradii (strain DSM 24694 / JCM 17849 / CGMCC 1.5162 / HZ254) TaxID=1041930 RepID=H8IA50_METCZ|nr:aminopeptidase [Methanocella conradii]AFC99116.1 Leucyl aminopeptidase (aminopeptidase T) [Methanocella conradii HZ254]MDI6896638.1 aminopeptidase [Methanocella conradii]
MIDESIFPRLANCVLDSIGVKDGDAVFISGGSHEQRFLEEIGIAVARRGGQPFISAVSNDYQRRLLEACTVEQLKRMPKIMMGIAQAMDAYVIVEPYSDPTFKARFREKLQARSEGNFPVMQVIYGKPGKRWLYMGWATEEMARMYGVPLDVLERLVIGGCSVEPGLLKERCEHIMSALKGARYVHVTDPHGTDFRLNIEGRRLNPDDGVLSPEKVAVGDLGGNLPAGEVFVAPVETHGSGTIYCPLTIDDLTRGTIIKGVRLVFKDGTLMPDECTAEVNQEVLRDTIQKMVKLDVDKYGAPNALKVAELGIGLNPVIDRAIGYILTDEKIGGSVHVAFGRSDMYGGNVQSNMHWDFVTAPDATIEVEYGDGSRRLIMKDGRLLQLA